MKTYDYEKGIWFLLVMILLLLVTPAQASEQEWGQFFQNMAQAIEGQPPVGTYQPDYYQIERRQRMQQHARDLEQRIYRQQMLNEQRQQTNLLRQQNAITYDDLFTPR